MKQRSMNKIPIKGTKKLQVGSYQKIRQKYHSDVPALLSISREKVPQQQQIKSEMTNQQIQKKISVESKKNEKNLNAPKRKWTNINNKSNNIQQIDVNSRELSESVYMMENENAIKSQSQQNQIDVPPLVIHSSAQSRQYENLIQSQRSRQKSKQKSLNASEQNDNQNFKEIQRTPNNQFLTLTRQILANISLNKITNPWQNKTPNQILCSILVNNSKMELFLKYCQQQSINQFHTDKNQWQNSSTNIQILTCLLQKIKDSQNNGNASIDIAFHNKQPQLKFSNMIKANQQKSNSHKQNRNEIKLKKQYEDKCLLVESVRNQYDKIISNYATTVMNLMSEKTNKNNKRKSINNQFARNESNHQQIQKIEQLKPRRLKRNSTFNNWNVQQ